MTPEQWQSVRDKIDSLLAVEASRRAAYLDQIAGSDWEFRRELESLLISHDNMAADFLNVPLYSEPGVAPSLPTSLIGKRLGSYQIVSEIGKGGMGEVYRSLRVDDQYQKEVAIKLIRAERESAFVVARFKRERQILAKLEHPNIARLLDGGTTPEGVPYLVMELIEGEWITQYCERRSLDITARLELFLQVCAAVQFAHQRLIVHRDIKPGNILVTADGTPKLLDFGISKILNDENEASPADRTITAVRMLTPAYASPEQVKGEPITTASDVYSLGVVLYELLAGRRPYQAEGTPEQIARVICEQEPEKPSSAAQSSLEQASIRLPKHETAQKASKCLRGDLDRIVLMALRKEPQRRYASASEFAADIQRYLNHEAVLAVPPSLWYRTRKFARRYRVVLASASALVLVLVVATGVSIREGVRANREAAVAEAVNEFLQNDLLAQASALAQSGPNTKPDLHLEVRTALDRAAQRIEGRFTNQPEVEASIRDTMGWTYFDLGSYPEARKQLEQALELGRRVLGPEDPKTLKSMEHLGIVALHQGKFAEAEALTSRALEAERRVLGAEHRATLASMIHLASVYHDEGKFAQAEALDIQASEIEKRMLGPEHPETLMSMNNLAIVYMREGKYSQAEALDTQILEIRKRVLGLEHPYTVGSMNNLSLVYMREGKYSQAEALEIQTLEIRKRVLGPEHPYTLQSMTNLANVYLYEGKFPQAEALYTQALEIQRRVVGPEHPDTAATLYDVGCVAARRGDKDRAIALLGQSVDHGLDPRGDLGIEKDTDLTSLHGDPRFAALVAHAKQVAEAKQKAAATRASK
jgi:serine/threonine protein kinase/tetratricopeptide (TPR) repeat protein